MSQATVTIHTTFLPHTDPEASLAFYRDGLGFELRLDVGEGTMRWLTVGPANQPDTAFVLTPAGMGDYTDEEKAVITAMMAKGTYATVILASTDLDATFSQLKESGATVLQEIADEGWGTRDCVFRDPAGNTVRIQQAA
ncbi:MAG TPA: VOC family protein [Thermomicrobiales bacterium]|nr:VOC family protein [Thermomicrobiales bacterium]